MDTRSRGTSYAALGLAAADERRAGEDRSVHSLAQQHLFVG